MYLYIINKYVYTLTSQSCTSLNLNIETQWMNNEDKYRPDHTHLCNYSKHRSYLRPFIDISYCLRKHYTELCFAVLFLSFSSVATPLRLNRSHTPWVQGTVFIAPCLTVALLDLWKRTAKTAQFTACVHWMYERCCARSRYNRFITNAARIKNA